MHILSTVQELVTLLKNQVWQQKRLGFVPTMGAIHQGHLSLVKESVRQCEYTIASIFVNPAQFNNQEDLEKYPRQTDSDLEMLKSAGCNAVFLPSVEEMYPNDDYLKIDFGSLERIMEGKFRPGHFSGVGIIVSKFFNLIRPNVAFFGQKDLQQVAVIKKLTKDLNFPLDISVVETMREENGLAMSSRNLRLSERGLAIASEIYKLLTDLKQMILNGEAISTSREKIINSFNKVSAIELEYLEVVDSDTLESVENTANHEKVSICIAAHLEKVRLIDNLYIK
ncbi:pantoate--beta-alanine ligase [Reichenbachiella versicolor]|uniref:pantoate--beta-alanine ligase n=1 Tax=Reichenbachiella versicolor TaxID=1821036 RepID=UPI000D6E0889|nr:pantoate--beta-alanine ligase [Reichenbachiella versicolor]